jgi:carbon storage regulator CsrA
MLVLSRRPKEKILFPSIHTEIEILGMKNGQVRLGIEAPPEISVVREELAGNPENDSGENQAGGDPDRTRETRHEIRNRLNDAGLMLAVLRGQVKRGDWDRAEQTMVKLEEDFRLLKGELEMTWSGRRPEKVEEAVGVPYK